MDTGNGAAVATPRRKRRTRAEMEAARAAERGESVLGHDAAAREANEVIGRNADQVSALANETIAVGEPYIIEVKIEGVADMLWHRWSNEDVEAKAAAAKGSRQKKTDNIESYVYRTDEGNMGIPGDYFRACIANAARFKQDPRSPRKSLVDLTKAGVQVITQIADLGTAKWDYEDRRRVTVQRNAITRVRPALKKGWKATFELAIVLPEFFPPQLVYDLVAGAGKFVGLADFRPTYGRFQIVGWQVREGGL